jgi:hypothetical protein
MSILQAAKGKFMPHVFAPSPRGGIGGYKQQASEGVHGSKMLQYAEIVKNKNPILSGGFKTNLEELFNTL